MPQTKAEVNLFLNIFQWSEEKFSKNVDFSHSYLAHIIYGTIFPLLVHCDTQFTIDLRYATFFETTEMNFNDFCRIVK